MNVVVNAPRVWLENQYLKVKTGDGKVRLVAVVPLILLHFLL